MAEFFNRLMDNLRSGPLGPVVRWAEDHPRLAMWIVLGVGMVAILIPEMLKVDMLWYQRLVLVVATILVAGACVWIVTWEDEDEVEGEAAPEPAAKAEAQIEAAPAADAPAKKTSTQTAKKGTGRLSKKKKSS